MRALLIGLLILTLWTGFDYVLHVAWLAPYYGANPSLWRPLAELDVGLVFAVRVILIAAFMASYGVCVAPKNLRRGTLFGALIGVQLGVGVGVGTYLHMPIPAALAAGWVVGAVVKSTVAGLVVGGLWRRGQPAAT